MMAELFDEEKMREEDNEAIRAEGKADGIISTLVSLVKIGKLSITQAAAETHMTEDEFKVKRGLTI